MSSVTPVCVHVRNVDYERHLAVLYKLPPVDRTYFSRAFKYINHKVS